MTSDNFRKTGPIETMNFYEKLFRTEGVLFTIFTDFLMKGVQLISLTIPLYQMWHVIFTEKLNHAYACSLLKL